MLRIIKSRRQQARIKRAEALEKKYVELAARDTSIQTYNAMVKARNPELYTFEQYIPKN